MTDTTITIERDVEMPMRDGVVLRGDVWMPAGAGPHPAILFRTPYNKALLNPDVLRPSQCADAGYLAVVQDTRGRFASDGEWQAIMWPQEAHDTYDTVEWIAEQPWCDGNVGMAGPSYVGIVQWLGAMERPPHLRAIAPTMTTSAEHDAVETGGAIRLDHIATWLVFMAADWLGKQLAAGEHVDPITAATIARYATNPREALNVLPLVDLLDLPGLPISMGDLLSARIDNRPDVDMDRVDVPTLSVGGWFDVFCGSTVALHESAASRDPEPGHHCLIMGPWAHAGLLPHTQGEINFGLLAAANYAQVPQKHLEFFDVHLRGRQHDLPRVRYFVAGANDWRTADVWPPPGSSEQHWYLGSGGQANTTSGDGLLADAPGPGDANSDMFTYDPDDPVPSHGGRVLYLGELVGGPFAQNHIEQRNDVCCYTTPSLDAPIDAVGPVSVVLHASTSAVDTDFVVKLVDVFPDDRAIVVADGAIRARYRKGFETEHPVEPGAAEEYRIELGHIGWRFLSGHRIRLDVTSSNFPHLDRNMNTGAPVGTDGAGVVARQEILHTEMQPSRIILTVCAVETADHVSGEEVPPS